MLTKTSALKGLVCLWPTTRSIRAKLTCHGRGAELGFGVAIFILAELSCGERRTCRVQCKGSSYLPALMPGLTPGFWCMYAPPLARETLVAHVAMHLRLVHMVFFENI